MGLNIHYRLDFAGTEDQARDFVSRLREAAVKFHAGEVTPMQETSDDDSILKLASSSWVLTGESSHLVEALKFFGFVMQPSEGCEPVAMGLAQFPEAINVEGLCVDTELGKDWHWIQHVKTQYVSNPEFGGIQNSLQCHLTICALLEKAKDFGATIYVDDESGYWEHRNVDKLVNAVNQLNKMLAGLLGALKDLKGGDEASGSIQDVSNFEHLEAEAVSNPKMAASLRKVAEDMDGASLAGRRSAIRGSSAG